jgi:hypothetical protein
VLLVRVFWIAIEIMELLDLYRIRRSVRNVQRSLASGVNDRINVVLNPPQLPQLIVAAIPYEKLDRRVVVQRLVRISYGDVECLFVLLTGTREDGSGMLSSCHCSGMATSDWQSDILRITALPAIADDAMSASGDSYNGIAFLFCGSFDETS